MSDNAVFMTQQLDGRTDIKFEQNEKVLVIEINPQKVSEYHQKYFQQLGKIVVKYLDYQLTPCLVIFYGRNYLEILSNPLQVKNDDQRIVMFTNNQNQLMDTQGIWIHLNKEGLNLNIGYGEAREETMVLKYNMEQAKTNIQKIDRISISQESIPKEIFNQIISNEKKAIKIHTKDHFIPKLNLVILQECKNILDLHYGSWAQNLAQEINDLYQQVKEVELHQIERYFQQEVKFYLGDLIHHSVTTEGCKLNQILKNKQEIAQQNGLDPLMTYLRLGLGQFNQNSAGHQFVLEVWPFKHFSSIHDHAGQFGIIKVLQGVIDIKIYSILSNAQHLMNPIQVLTCNKNAITWLAPKLNQVHKVKNFYPQTAITLQCYKYSQKKTDKEKIKQMDFVANQQYLSFAPQSDVKNLELKDIFKELVEEYSSSYSKR